MVTVLLQWNKKSKKEGGCKQITVGGTLIVLLMLFFCYSISRPGARQKIQLSKKKENKVGTDDGKKMKKITGDTVENTK